MCGDFEKVTKKNAHDDSDFVIVLFPDLKMDIQSI